MIWTVEHAAWLVYALFFVVGDTATTLLGLETKGVSEGNGLAAFIFNRTGRLGDFTALVVAKTVVSILLYAATLHLPPQYQTALVSIIAALGVGVVGNNLWVLWRAERG